MDLQVTAVDPSRILHTDARITVLLHYELPLKEASATLTCS